MDQERFWSHYDLPFTRLTSTRSRSTPGKIKYSKQTNPIKVRHLGLVEFDYSLQLLENCLSFNLNSKTAVVNLVKWQIYYCWFDFCFSCQCVKTFPRFSSVFFVTKCHYLRALVGTLKLEIGNQTYGKGFTIFDLHMILPFWAIIVYSWLLTKSYGGRWLATFTSA